MSRLSIYMRYWGFLLYCMVYNFMDSILAADMHCCMFQLQASYYGKVPRHIIKTPNNEASTSTDLSTSSELYICLQSDLLSGFKKIFKAKNVHHYFTDAD